MQQGAFLIAQDIAQNWNAIVFIAVRPQTFFLSKRAETLSAYPHKVLTILPPRPEQVLEKRLVFALKLAEGKIPVQFLKNVRLHIQSMAMFLKALINSVTRNRDLQEILSNITGGNIRTSVEFMTRFIGSPNVDAEKIVRIMMSDGDYIIPIHEFSKSAILGDCSHYNPGSSLAMNLFEVRFPDEREHFLSSMIVSYLLSDASPKDKNFFTRTSDVLLEMAKWHYSPPQIETSLRQLTNRKLIETTERVIFEEVVSGFAGEMPAGFRITSIGAYHIKRWIGTFAYIEAMCFDTPIFDEIITEAMSLDVEQFYINVRLRRACLFRDYLSAVWGRAQLAPSYFDWPDVLKQWEHTFKGVQHAVQSGQAGSYRRRH